MRTTSTSTTTVTSTTTGSTSTSTGPAYWRACGTRRARTRTRLPTADALTAVPLAIAFIAGRRPPTRRYTYGYGRAEDLAGVAIVALILASSVLAAYEALTRLAHPQRVSDLIAVAAAALVGFRQGTDPHAVLVPHR
jgi:Cation efflux family